MGDPSTAAPPATSSTDLLSLFATIKAQEADFVLPVPDTSETLTIGTIDLSNVDGSGIATLEYSVPTYEDGSATTVTDWSVQVSLGPIPIVGGTSLSSFLQRSVTNIGATVTVANIKNLNLRIAIGPGSPQWRGSNLAAISVTLGGQTQKVTPSATEIIFENVLANSSGLSITLTGVPFKQQPTISQSAYEYDRPAFNQPMSYLMPGLLPVKLTWAIVGAGCFLIPVIPVCVVYAPPVDTAKKNVADLATSKTTGLSTTVSFSTQTSQTSPATSSWQSTSDLAKDMNSVGTVLKVIPIPAVQAVGAALSLIAGGLGSSTATNTEINLSATQQQLSINTTSSVDTTAEASDGGPGVGDVISYCYNARVVWYSFNGTMQLGLLGYEGFLQKNVSELQESLAVLKTKVAGTVDTASSQLDSVSLSALLALDPFASGGPGVDLSTLSRFSLVSPRTQISAGQQKFSQSYTLTQADLETKAQTNTFAQQDSPGFLSFIGLGVTDQNSLQIQITQSVTKQATVGQTFTQGYTLLEGPDAFEIYFDKVYGAFAFRIVP
jgi:hypothetical protein